MSGFSAGNAGCGNSLPSLGPRHRRSPEDPKLVSLLRRMLNLKRGAGQRWNDREC